MENFTLNIERLLKEKLSLYQQLNAVFTREQDFITRMEIDALWKSADEKKSIARKIEQIRADILEILNTKVGRDHMDIHSFSLAHLIRILPVSSEEKTGLRVIKLAIDTEKNQLAQRAKDNKKYVSQYLSVIDEIMSTIVDHSKLARYNQTGHLPKKKANNCLIHAEA